MEKKIGFGRDEDVIGIYQRYLGAYVLIYVQGPNTTFSGRVDSIGGEYLILNPFLGGEYNKDNGLTRKLIPKDSIVRISDITSIEPTTKENMDNYAEFSNKTEKDKAPIKTPNS